jgi:TolA-binding protein
MKAKQRHQLKQNEFAEAARRVMAWAEANRDRAIMAAVAIVAIVAMVGGVLYWRQHQANEAGGLLGAAIAISQAPIAPAPTLPGASQQPGTFPTEEARLEAAVTAYDAVIAQYPSSSAAMTARYYKGSALLGAGRGADAEQAFQSVIDEDGSSYLASLARLGRGEALVLQDRHDEAIQIFSDLSADRTGDLPVDGILMQLARASLRAGRVDDARAAFRRVVDEFPTSTFAAEARRELTALGAA